MEEERNLSSYINEPFELERLQIRIASPATAQDVR
jgi:hypothetical protein